MEAGAGDEPGDVDERPDVFLRRRRIHHDDAAATRALGAEVAAKARIAGGEAKARRIDAVPRRDRVEPRRECDRAGRIGPFDAGGRCDGGSH
jgi:hypothetical protein